MMHITMVAMMEEITRVIGTPQVEEEVTTTMTEEDRTTRTGPDLILAGIGVVAED
jgi:hypothetical protein